MYINKLTFKWKKSKRDTIDVGNIYSIDVILDRENENPLIIIDAGKIKIEDRSLSINSEEILKSIGKLDLEPVSKYEPKEYCGDAWELTIDDIKYEGTLDNPKFVNEIRKIIKLNAIQNYANKKIGNYFK